MCVRMCMYTCKWIYVGYICIYSGDEQRHLSKRICSWNSREQWRNNGPLVKSQHFPPELWTNFITLLWSITFDFRNLRNFFFLHSQLKGTTKDKKSMRTKMTEQERAHQRRTMKWRSRKGVVNCTMSLYKCPLMKNLFLTPNTHWAA